MFSLSLCYATKTSTLLIKVDFLKEGVPTCTKCFIIFDQHLLVEWRYAFITGPLGCKNQYFRQNPKSPPDKTTEKEWSEIVFKK